MLIDLIFLTEEKQQQENVRVCSRCVAYFYLKLSILAFLFIFRKKKKADLGTIY